MIKAKNHSIIVFFDDECVLCNASVQFILKYESKHTLLFAPLFGTTFQAIDGSSEIHNDSLIVYKNNQLLIESDAIIGVLTEMGSYWKYLASILLIIPPFIRNAVYSLIARNRKQWFGKAETCLVITGPLKSRFFP